LITAISAGLSFLSYHSERIITPVILISLLINNWKVVVNKKNSKVLIISILAGLILVLPTVKLMVTPGFLSRLNSLSIFSIEVKKPWGFDENLIGWKSLIFNNQTELQLREFASLYTSYFSPRYLFGLGDPGPRSSYPDLSPLLWWQLIFFLIGVFWIFAKRNKKEKDLKFLIILILLVSPIPASVTKDPFSSIRSLPLVFPLIVLVAIGIDKCLKRFNFLGKIGLTILIIWSVGRIYIPIFKFNDYFRGRFWDEGIEEMVTKIKDENLRNLLYVILSRTIRSCRATTHADLATLIEPIVSAYYCSKHGKICKPLFSIYKWWETYSKDTIDRIKEFNNLRTNTEQICLTGDSRNIDIFEKLEKNSKLLAEIAKKKKINGIFSSPPYVGLIDYHEQHAYAYDLFEFKRNDDFEIGPLFKGQGREAKENYLKGITETLLNCKKYLIKNYDIFLVANDKYNLYPTIAENAGMKIENKYTRPVLNRTEKDKRAYSEIIFHLKEK
ncbi:MAG TPA: hypothetical protein PKY81_16795, partial [bacterium]|nr:hypothetical protein [bacterium]